ncbi:MAG: 50S ribosomal protein L30, partial [Bacteroidetes bacterium]|nr:50S ribosomal protein L30 [Bacteroidota bacterium]
QKLTIEALGLGRPNYSNILPDNPQTRGMLEVVKHLVKVEQVAN